MAMIQIRGVSDDAHRRLKARAALKGMSLSEYLRLEIEQIASLPTMEEMIDRVARDEPVELSQPAAEIIRQEREARDAAIDARHDPDR
jgi:plasmid stability protein